MQKKTIRKTLIKNKYLYNNKPICATKIKDHSKKKYKTFSENLLEVKFRHNNDR